MSNVKDIIKKYLMDGNYDGLYNVDVACACHIDNLFPYCYEGVEDCQPGYKTECNCESDIHDYHISSSKDLCSVGAGITKSKGRCTICNSSEANHPEDGLCADCYRKMKKKRETRWF
jgi:hypothetical protein